MAQGGMPLAGMAIGEPGFRENVAEPDEERLVRRLPPRLDFGVGGAALLISTLVLWQVFRPLSQGSQYYLVIFLGLTLPLVFLCYRPRRRRPAAMAMAPRQGGGDGIAVIDDDIAVDGRPTADVPGAFDWVLAVLALLVGLYPVLPLTIVDGGGGFDAFLDRQGVLSTLDILAGATLLLLILEAARRTSGLMLPTVCLVFLGYSYYGGYLPQDWSIAHAGIDFSQIINGLYNDASGFYGVPLDVAATYVVLFTIYGAVLNVSGAGQFFVKISLAAFGQSRTAPGRTVALSGFLLGSVSGSGSATTVTLGAITWPILRRAGYPKENAGGLLAASGIGAILSPPTLGAAAFIIAEYVGTSYANVLVWALVPTLLYYFGILLAVEADARKFGAKAVPVDVQKPWKLLLRGGYHFASLAIIVMFLALGITPFFAVIYATAMAAGFALVAKLVERRETPVLAVGDWARSLAWALATGVLGALPVIAVCVAAGVITSAGTKTGLGQVLSSALVNTADALADNPTVVLLLAALFSALAVGVIGLAVPVTASFIIAWITLGPALGDLGVSPAETAMFLFYYAVLSEVTPPTALASAAASGITGGSINATMWQTWKYTMPGFLLPIAFVVTDNGSALLSQRPLVDVLWVTAVSALGVVALAGATTGWMFRLARWPERVLCVPAALLLLYLEPWAIAVGVGFLLSAVIVHVLTSLRPAVPKIPAFSREG